MKSKMMLTSAAAFAAAFGFAAPAMAQEEIVVGHLTYHTGEFGAFGPFFDGVTEVVADDSTGCRWVVRWHGEAPPVQALIDACHAKGWGLAAIAPEQRTLEGVFADLQRQHALGGDA